MTITIYIVVLFLYVSFKFPVAQNSCFVAVVIFFIIHVLTPIFEVYALTKHPLVMEIVKRRGIAIEVNPISNQVLNLVKDLRNHPAVGLFAEDFPVVISNDDPGLWGSRALSYDFYQAFMGIMSQDSDLRSLKQLALNSITHSTMNKEDKENAFKIWQEKWRIFVRELIFHVEQNISY